MQSLPTVPLGEHRITNPAEGEPDFLSAASGTAWSPRTGTLFSVGDDQNAIGQFYVPWDEVQEALRTNKGGDILRPGRAQRILPEALPQDATDRNHYKPDFEALTIIKPEHIAAVSNPEVRDESLRRFPHGLLYTSGSGGQSRTGHRRSLGVVYSLDEQGNMVGLPSKVSLEGLHDYLKRHVVNRGNLNVEGTCVHDGQLVLAQRGNSLDEQKQPAPNMLIWLNLGEVLESLYTDLVIGACELEVVREYDLGYARLEYGDGKAADVKLDFTDLDSVTGDPHGRMVFTGAAEARGNPEIDGAIAGSVVGVISGRGELQSCIPLEDSTIKIEGVDARYNPAVGSIDLLLASDADDPEVPAPLLAARLFD